MQKHHFGHFGKARQTRFSVDGHLFYFIGFQMHNHVISRFGNIRKQDILVIL